MPANTVLVGTNAMTSSWGVVPALHRGTVDFELLGFKVLAFKHEHNFSARWYVPGHDSNRPVLGLHPSNCTATRVPVYFLLGAS